MKAAIFLLPLATLGLCAGTAHAAVYTWTGAVDNDWTNAANWDANGVPVDTDITTSALDQQTQNDNIIISGSVAPSVNIPQFAGGNAFDRSKENTPEIQLLGGTMTVSAGTWNNQGQVHNGSWSSSVGDGDSGNGLAVLNYSIIQGAGSGLNRDDNSLMAWTVNADGTLNIDYTAGSTLRFAYSSTRTIGFNLPGGTVNIADALDLDGHAGNFFDLTAAGASVTANFGGDFADLTAVNAAIGTHFISTTTQPLGAADNTDGTFTVSVIPEPGTMMALAMSALCVLRRRR